MTRPPLWMWCAVYLAALLAVVLLPGCGKPAALSKGEADLRVKLFQQCMELSAKNARQRDDDVSDIVKACDQTSAYQAMQWAASQ